MRLVQPHLHILIFVGEFLLTARNTVSLFVFIMHAFENTFQNFSKEPFQGHQSTVITVHFLLMASFARQDPYPK